MKHAHAEDEKKNPEAQLNGESLRLSATVQD
jgi:hypothetical protein